MPEYGEKKVDATKLITYSLHLKQAMHPYQLGLHSLSKVGHFCFHNGNSWSLRNSNVEFSQNRVYRTVDMALRSHLIVNKDSGFQSRPQKGYGSVSWHIDAIKN